MSQPEIPEGDLLRAVLLARVAQHSHSRYAVTWALTSNNAFLHERILRLVLDESAPIDKDVRLTLLNILNEEMNRQSEVLFTGEIEDIRKYLELLRLMGCDVDEQVSARADLDKRFNALMDKVKRAEAMNSQSVKESKAALGPIIREFNSAKDDLKNLRHAVDKKAWELLGIYCRKIDVEASDKLFKVLTQEL
jgi:hypothetical protein